MALNLKTLATRSMSAAVFVVVLLGSVLWCYASFAVFFFVVGLIAVNEFYRMSEKLGYAPYKISGFVCAVILYAVFLNVRVAGESLLDLLPSFKPVIALMPIFIFTVALFSKRENPIQNSLFTIAGLLYAMLPFALLQQLVSLPETPGTYEPITLIGIIFLIWSNDTFAYLGGSLFGKNKMIERISPGKTWEGTIFGVIVTFGISFLVKNYLDAGHGSYWPLFGLIVPVMATIGDLVESMLKRQAGVKDSGSIMPGHGGALDRFDSLIFVTPFAVVFFYFL